MTLQPNSSHWVQAQCHSTNTSSHQLQRKKKTSRQPAVQKECCCFSQKITQWTCRGRGGGGGGGVVRFLGSVPVMERGSSRGMWVSECVAVRGCQIWWRERSIQTCLTTTVCSPHTAGDECVCVCWREKESDCTGKTCSWSLLVSADVGHVLFSHWKTRPKKSRPTFRSHLFHQQLGLWLIRRSLRTLKFPLMSHQCRDNA